MSLQQLEPLQGSHNHRIVVCEIQYKEPVEYSPTGIQLRDLAVLYYPQRLFKTVVKISITRQSTSQLLRQNLHQRQIVLLHEIQHMPLFPGLVHILQCARHQQDGPTGSQPRRIDGNRVPLAGDPATLDIRGQHVLFRRDGVVRLLVRVDGREYGVDVRDDTQGVAVRRDGSLCWQFGWDRADPYDRFFVSAPKAVQVRDACTDHSGESLGVVC